MTNDGNGMKADYIYIYEPTSLVVVLETENGWRRSRHLLYTSYSLKTCILPIYIRAHTAFPFAVILTTSQAVER